MGGENHFAVQFQETRLHHIPKWVYFRGLIAGESERKKHGDECGERYNENSTFVWKIFEKLSENLRLSFPLESENSGVEVHIT